MIALALGLFAALTWGIHDLLVRLVSQRMETLPALFVVLSAGTLIMARISVTFGAWADMTGLAYGIAAGSGLAFAIAGYALYRAFEIGPVRIVAPTVGAFPAISVLFAWLGGSSITALQGVAVLAIIAGTATP